MLRLPQLQSRRLRQNSDSNRSPRQQNDMLNSWISHPTHAHTTTAHAPINPSHTQEHVESLEDMQSRSLATMHMRRRVVRARHLAHASHPDTPPSFTRTTRLSKPPCLFRTPTSIRVRSHQCHSSPPALAQRKVVCHTPSHKRKSKSRRGVE